MLVFFRQGSAELDATESEMIASASDDSQATPATPFVVTDQRYKHFMKLLYELIQEKYQVGIHDVYILMLSL